MKQSELPIEVQNQLAKDRMALSGKVVNGAYTVQLYNAEGTRYFYARRSQEPWWDNKGNYMPFGGGSHWSISYGAVQFRCYKSPLGTREYELCYGKRYNKSANGTEVPFSVATKKEVIAIAKSIGIFNI
jgi:hypothetical protein